MGTASRKPSSLKAGRPPLTSGPLSNARSSVVKKKSSKATRTVIRAHHNLHKSRAKALLDGKHDLVADLDAQIEQLGGLEAYQAASLTGQRKDRGGDSSHFLVKWLEEEGLVGKSSTQKKGLRVLEIGALSSSNAISHAMGKGIDCVRRIDLKSQEPGRIEEIDFMQLPIPQTEIDKFDVVSLSLVLNYVPEPIGRGEMLKRTREFFRDPELTNNTTPCLFFVLPLPCIENSRHMTADHLREIMASLGYCSVRYHQSAKLYYELYRLERSSQKNARFKKTTLNAGKKRNNFCITLDGD